MGYVGSAVREHWTFIYSPSDTPETASDGVIFYHVNGTTH